MPIDEIERPIIELRNRTLFYSIAVLVFVLPLYVTLIVAWIDRRAWAVWNRKPGRNDRDFVEIPMRGTTRELA